MFKFIRKKKNLISAGLIIALTLSTGLTGCGKKTASDIPELLDPLASNSSFRPVEKMPIGDINMLYGTVVPETYPVFNTIDISIKEICVGIGDYVHEGDVIATGITEDYQTQIELENNTIASLNEERTMRQGQEEQAVNKDNLFRQACEDVGDGEGVTKYEREIYKEQENLRYYNELIDTRIATANSNIEKMESKYAKFTFTAPHDGYITYVSDISRTNVVPANINIAVISDFDDLYIEIPDCDIKLFKFKDYKFKYTMIDGKKTPVESYDYSGAEVSCATSNSKYPPVRYKLLPGMKMGDTVPLYFVKNEEKEGISVGNDSIYRDGDDVYVYVEGEDGSLVKRNVETGIVSNDYTEILSGLEEGERVYYESNAPVPAKYSNYNVEVKDYSLPYKCNSYERAVTRYDIYTTKYTGDYDSPTYQKNEEIKAGEELYSIDSSTGRAQVEEARVNLSQLTSMHNETLERYDSMLSTYLAELDYANSEVKPNASDTDAMKNYLYHSDRVKCDLNSLELERDYENTCYSRNYETLANAYNKVCEQYGDDGLLRVQVKEDGYFGTFANEKKSLVYAGQFIASVGHKSSSILTVKMREPDADNFREPARIGQKVEIQIKDGATYTGTCVALNGVDTRFYLFTRNGKQYITSSPGYKENTSTTFYVKLDDVDTASISDATVNYIGTSMSKVITIPSKTVNSEISQLSKAKHYYVWKVVGDELVKHYITVYENKVPMKDTLVLSGLEEGDIIASEK